MGNYFYDLYKRERLLQEHGVDQWPTDYEVLIRIFLLEDRLERLEKESAPNPNGGDRHG